MALPHVSGLSFGRCHLTALGKIYVGRCMTDRKATGRRVKHVKRRFFKGILRSSFHRFGKVENPTRIKCDLRNFIEIDIFHETLALPFMRQRMCCMAIMGC